MKIVACSDTHGILPEIPECDLLLIGGDICPVENHNIYFQASWLNSRFKNWIKGVPAKHKVICAGNHDFVFQKKPGLVQVEGYHYLQDSFVEIEGWKVYGSPWQLAFFDWAFNLLEEELVSKWQLIPEDTDILLLHGPPHGYGDGVARSIRDEEKWPEPEHVGSPSLLEKIKIVKPKLVVFGHIHEGRGQWKLEETILANVTIVNNRYEHVYDPFIFYLEK